MKTARRISLDKSSQLSYPVSSYIQSNIPLILDMVEKLKPELDENKEVILWCRGSSGAIIAGIMATHIENARISHVKKDGEGSHSGSISTTPNDRKNTINVIVDDFMNTGDTLNAIYEQMKAHKIKVHGLCISGTVYLKNIKFKPEFIISGSISKTI
jgi:adenine/guanine phosphoribosyltransferase-like PRPP-binding protein